MPAVFLITGCTSGFGRALVKDALGRGHSVIATGRKPEKLQDLESLGAKTLRLDVTDTPEHLKAVAKQAIEFYGKIDYLINNAGYRIYERFNICTKGLHSILIMGNLEEFNQEQISLQWNTNFFGVMHVTNAFLPYFRKARSGVIVNISSESGILWESDLGVYSTTKAALDMYSDCLGKEVAALGIKVMTIQPGEYDTEMSGNVTSVDPEQKIADYKFPGLWETRGAKNPGSPAAAAKRMLDVITLSGVAEGRQSLPTRFAIGGDAVYHVRKFLKERTQEHEEWADLGKGEGQAKVPNYAKEE